jgi:hypothetical protein
VSVKEDLQEACVPTPSGMESRKYGEEPVKSSSPNDIGIISSEVG